MYITRLELNRRSTQVRAELADPYQMHRTLSLAFGVDDAIWKEARCLFRVDEPPGRDDLWSLVQSRVLPDWTRLKVPPAYLAATPQVKEFSPEFASGQRLAFRLRANPTIKRQGKRYAIRDEEDQLAWLARKGETGGFRLGRTVAKPEPFLRTHTASRQQAQLSAVRFDGVLQVTDPAALREVIENGIGSGKAFGFGLLSVARA